MKASSRPASLALLLLLPLALSAGCKNSASDSNEPQPQQANNETGISEPAGAKPTTASQPASQPDELAVAPIEINGPELLAMRLTPAQTEMGWVRLFDGATLFGWEVAGNANWRVEDNTLRANAGEVSLLCTSLPWADYELSVEFMASDTTNSGIFLRTPLAPEDPATDCYELNIAPTDNPFPTGSLVKRKLFSNDDLGDFDPATWHTYLVRCEGPTITVSLDGRELYSFTDEAPILTGRIGLQFNQGEIQFRNVLARPIGFQPLLPTEASDDGSLANWKRYPNMPGTFELNQDGILEVRGGRAQLESEASYGNFVLLASAKTNGTQQNSGIFFRCIPGEEMNGYECQINNDRIDDNPLLPADCGTGGIFRRLNARIVAAEPDQWFTLFLMVHDDQMAAWVNGIQVSEWRDDRNEDPNPRRGKRLQPGTLMIQGHDPGTSVDFQRLNIIALDQ